MLTANWQELFDALDYIYTNFGVDVINEQNKIKTLLLDLAPNAKRETKAFLGILTEQELIKKIKINQDIDFDYVVNQIEDSSGLTEAWATNITEAIFIVVGKREFKLNNKEKTKEFNDNTIPSNEPVNVQAPCSINTLTEGRLSMDSSDISRTYDPGIDFIELPFVGNKLEKFIIEDNIIWYNSEYYIVSRHESHHSVLFFVFKKTSSIQQPFAYVCQGKNLIRVYRKFIERNKKKFKFTDESDVQPKIQQPSTNKKTKRIADNNKSHNSVFEAEDAKKLFGVGSLPDIIEIPYGYDEIGFYPFIGYKSDSVVSKVVLPDSIKSINAGAFLNLKIVGQLVIPDSVSYISDMAFSVGNDRCFGNSGYVVCSETSYAYQFAKKNKLKNSVDLAIQYRNSGLCQYCGGKFTGVFKKKCSVCGIQKDY